MKRIGLVLALLFCGAWTHGTPGTTLTAVLLSANTFSAPCSAGTNVGTVSVTASGGSFTGSLSITGTDAASFQLSGTSLQCSGSAAAGTYAINLVATQSGATGSPLTQPETITGTSGAVAFTPLHTYFMATTGSDANNGTSSGTPWKTPNHAGLVCGDVIIAAAGDYSTAWATGLSSQPGTCPSTTAGIDGAGGVYSVVVLCGGNVGTCFMNGTATSGSLVKVTASNWAVEGFKVSSNSVGSTGMRGFDANACASGSTVIHDIYFINDIATHTQVGFFTSDCGLNHNVPGNGPDYWFTVGSIAQNSNNDPICVAAIDAVGVSNFDTVAGIHVGLIGNFSYNNQTTACTTSDTEGMMFDTLDAHGVVGTYVAKNNMLWNNGWAGLQVFEQSFNSSSPTVNVVNNTLYGNNVCTQFVTGATGEINTQVNGGFPWTVNVNKNIALTNRTTGGCNGGGAVYANLTGGNTGTTVVNGGASTKNVYKGQRSSCSGTCDTGDNVVAFNSFSVGTNTYIDAAFADTTDLLTNWLAAPSCTSFASTTACMGWNYSTQTATANTPIADLAASAAGTTGNGYITPGPCAADANYSARLKGIVFLQWNGTSVTENAGLVQKPCGV